uniref:Aminotransferase-like plant mobile domain-containing protein n=1 Tax=Fagus sylvatica TaxID=28930 RepID=A0A2N9HUL7_FAGSY
MASIDVNTPAGNPEVQPRIRHHCIVSKLMDVNKSLSEQCKRQLQTTSFGWLLNLHCNIEASGRILEVMLASWNVDERAFQVGDRLIPFTLYDVALILGLSVRLHCRKRKKLEATCTFKVALPCFRSGHASTWGLDQKNAEINQPFPRFLAWTHQRMFKKKAMEVFSNSANVSVVRAYSDAMGATGIREDELYHAKGLVATVESSPTIQQNQPPPSQNLEQNQPPVQTQLPIQTPIVDLPSSPSKAIKRGKPVKKKVKAAIVDLASSPSKRDNEGEVAVAMVDLVSSPSKGPTSVRYTRMKTRAQKNVMTVPPELEPIRNEWVDTHFLYQPTAHAEAVLADLKKKWSFTIRRATRRSVVNSNEIAFSTETYEITSRDVSTLLGDQAQEESSRMIAQEFGNAFCWNYITIPYCSKLYKAKTAQFDCAVFAAQNCPILY